jgi:hypothetical protein
VNERGEGCKDGESQTGEPMSFNAHNMYSRSGALCGQGASTGWQFVVLMSATRCHDARLPVQ